ncbi:MAG: T9SS type A sorting domain-containing protein [Flavobacteriales bacterium]
MKKLVLPLMLVLGYSAVSAQCSKVGFDATKGVYDNFTDAVAPSNANLSGVYIWGETTLGGDANPAFQATVSRTAGKFDATVTQGAGGYVPFGLSFGDSNGDGTGTPFYMDLSGDKTFSAKCYNNSDSTLKFRMTIQDKDGKEIDTYATYATDGGGVFGNAYKYVIEITVDPHSSGTISGTYAGGVKSDYSNSTFVTGFDFTKVKGVYFTVTNSGNSGAPNYTHNGFSNLSVSIDDVQVGACPVGVNNLSAGESANVYPNPTSDMANVNLTLNQVSEVKITIVDMFGRTVKEVANGNYSYVNEQVSVSNLSQGVYTVNYTVDGAVAKSTLLMVK